MTDKVPTPEPDRILKVRQWLQDRDNAHAAAVSAELRADNARMQNEVVMPLRERVRVLEERVLVLTKLVDASEGGVDVDGVNWFDLREAARAALGDKTC